MDLHIIDDRNGNLPLLPAIIRRDLADRLQDRLLGQFHGLASKMDFRLDRHPTIAFQVFKGGGWVETQTTGFWQSLTPFQALGIRQIGRGPERSDP